MSIKLTNSILNCGTSSGKIRRLFIANWQSLRGYLLINNGVIEDITLPLDWYEIKNPKNSLDFSEKTEVSAEGFIYSQEIKCTTIQIEGSTQERYRELVRGKFVAIFQDSNNKWFLLGRNGAKITGYDARIGGDVNTHSFSIINRDRFPLNELSSQYYEDNLVVSPCADSGIYTDDVLTLEVPMWQVLNCNVYP